MRYRFRQPAGWTRHPFPPPQEGVQLRAPTAGGTPPASVLLGDPIAPAGAVEAQLETFVAEGCVGTRARPRGARRVGAGGWSGLAVTVDVEVSDGVTHRDEARVFALLEAEDARVPIVFVGSPESLAAHAAALEEILGSVGPLEPEPVLAAWWSE